MKIDVMRRFCEVYKASPGHPMGVYQKEGPTLWSVLSQAMA